MTFRFSPETKAPFSPGEALASLRGNPSSHSPRVLHPGPRRPQEHREVLASQSRALSAHAAGPCGRGGLGPGSEEQGGRPGARHPPGRPRPAPARSARLGRALPGRRRPRLTRVLATFPLWVMFLLCFSLAIRIRCLATMAWALGNALDSYLQESPRVSPPTGPRASRPLRALQVARRCPRAPRTPLPCPQRAGSRERPEPGRK